VWVESNNQTNSIISKVSSQITSIDFTGKAAQDMQFDKRDSTFIPIDNTTGNIIQYPQKTGVFIVGDTIPRTCTNCNADVSVIADAVAPKGTTYIIGCGKCRSSDSGGTVYSRTRPRPTPGSFALITQE
ncbi:MAG: hypothetical protein LBQ88_16495, partial [Treponema sp.]|nr:hypothetical protein [Treponema sp.]